MTRETVTKCIAFIYICLCTIGLGAMAGLQERQFSGAWWVLSLLMAAVVAVMGLMATVCERKHLGWRIWVEEC